MNTQSIHHVQSGGMVLGVHGWEGGQTLMGGGGMFVWEEAKISPTGAGRKRKLHTER